MEVDLVWRLAVLMYKIVILVARQGCYTEENQIEIPVTVSFFFLLKDRVLID